MVDSKDLEQMNAVVSTEAPQATEGQPARPEARTT